MVKGSVVANSPLLFVLVAVGLLIVIAYAVLSVVKASQRCKELGVSILPRSACMDELSKGKLAALPIENLSMVRETRIVYNGDFSHMDIMQEIIREYRETARMYR